jgi:hypothetical protein
MEGMKIIMESTSTVHTHPFHLTTVCVCLPCVQLLTAGNPQPAYKMEGMKIIMEFPKPKNPEEAGAMPEVERKQVRGVEAHSSRCLYMCVVAVLSGLRRLAVLSQFFVAARVSKEVVRSDSLLHQTLLGFVAARVSKEVVRSDSLQRQTLLGLGKPCCTASLALQCRTPLQIAQQDPKREYRTCCCADVW